MRLAEVRGEETESAADVEDAALVGQQEVHRAEELRSKYGEANERVRTLDRRQGANDVGDGAAAVDLGRLEGRAGGSLRRDAVDCIAQSGSRRGSRGDACGVCTGEDTRGVVGPRREGRQRARARALVPGYSAWYAESRICARSSAG